MLRPFPVQNALTPPPWRYTVLTASISVPAPGRCRFAIGALAALLAAAAALEENVAGDVMR